ncbi:MAG: DNA adenine methylase [Endomicrobiaceae bacterium]|nr:DNA adenine methylase [Endomicrobiaceae bacterium]
MITNINIKPFIKWAGGKKQLLSDIRQKYPFNIDNKINKYCEPFVGGGAVLFDILSNYQVEKILINDINKELINVYNQIKENVSELIIELSKIQNKFWKMDNETQKKFYYKRREEFNYLKVNGDEKVNIKKAVLFIFLNKTCFNGLFRVNSKGLFNVPKGSSKKPLICDEENLNAISKKMKKVSVICGDYKKCLSFIDKNTFVYLDPPYRPISLTASFTSYSENLFNDSEQYRLGLFIDKINIKGAKVILSNSDPKNINKKDNFFDDMYKNYNIDRIEAKRFINCDATKRSDITELLITNY